MSAVLSLSYRRPFLRVVAHSISRAKPPINHLGSTSSGLVGRSYVHKAKFSPQLPACQILSAETSLHDQQCRHIQGHGCEHTALECQQKQLPLFSDVTRAGAFHYIKTNSRDVSSLGADQLSSLLAAITRSDSDCCDLKHTEITLVLQWLHFAQCDAVNPQQAAVLQQYLTVVDNSIQQLPLPPRAPGASLGLVEAQERNLIVNTVYGLQNLTGVQDAMFSQTLGTLLATLLRRRKLVQRARQDELSRFSSPKAPSLRPGRRCKIVFAAAPESSFSDYILHCFSPRPLRARQHRPSRHTHPSRSFPSGAGGSRLGHHRSSPSSLSSPATAPGVSGHDIKLVLNGLHHLSSEQEEVSAEFLSCQPLTLTILYMTGARFAESCGRRVATAELRGPHGTAGESLFFGAARHEHTPPRGAEGGDRLDELSHELLRPVQRAAGEQGGGRAASCGSGAS